MRKVIFLFTFLLFGAASYASHLVGGYIRLERVFGNTYNITYTLYRDCGGAHIGENQQVRILNLCNGSNTFDQVALSYVGTTEVGQVCPEERETTNCVVSNGAPSFQRFEFTTTYTFPNSCDNWRIEASGNARNARVNSNGGNFYVFTDIDISNTDATPVLQNFPIPYTCQNFDFTYNPRFLSNQEINYRTVAGLTAANNNVGYINGYSAGTPIDDYSLNPFTGDITARPQRTGAYSIHLELDQVIPNGTAITSTTHYSFEIFSEGCTNQNPSFTGFSNLTNVQEQNRTISYCRQQSPKCFNITFSDPNASDQLSITDENLSQILINANISSFGTNPMTVNICFDGLVDPGIANGQLVIRDNNCPIQGEVVLNIIFDERPGIVTETNYEDSICRGDTIQLTANSSGNVRWFSPNNPGSISGQQNNQTISVHPTFNSTYIATFGDDCNPQREIYEIQVDQPYQVFIDPVNSFICSGGSVNLNASGADNYTWDPPQNLNSSTGSNVIASPTVTTRYTVVGTRNDNKCKAEANARIVVGEIQNNFIFISSCENLLLGEITGTDVAEIYQNVNYQWEQLIGGTWNEIPNTPFNSSREKDYTGIIGQCYRRKVQIPGCTEDISNTVCIPTDISQGNTFPEFFETSSEVITTSLKSNPNNETMLAGFFTTDIEGFKNSNFNISSNAGDAFGVKYGPCNAYDWHINGTTSLTPNQINPGGQGIFEDIRVQSFLEYSSISQEYYFVYPDYLGNSVFTTTNINGSVTTNLGNPAGTVIAILDLAGNLKNTVVLPGEFPTDLESPIGGDVFIATVSYSNGYNYQLNRLNAGQVVSNTIAFVPISSFNIPDNLPIKNDFNIEINNQNELFGVYPSSSFGIIDLEIFSLNLNNNQLNWSRNFFGAGQLYGDLSINNLTSDLLVTGVAFEQVQESFSIPGILQTSTLNSDLWFNYVVLLNPVDGSISEAKGFRRINNEDIRYPSDFSADFFGTGYQVALHNLPSIYGAGTSQSHSILGGMVNSANNNNLTSYNHHYFSNTCYRPNGANLISGTYQNMNYYRLGENPPNATTNFGFLSEFDSCILCVTDSNSDEATANQKVGIDRIEIRKDFKTYPNPVNSYFYIDIANPSSVQKIFLTSIDGRLVEINSWQKESQGIEVHLKEIPTGTYTINILTETGFKNGLISVVNH